MYKRHLAFSEASERRNHSEVLYLNLFKKTTTCVVAKPLVYINNRVRYRHKGERCSAKVLIILLLIISETAAPIWLIF